MYAVDSARRRDPRDLIEVGPAEIERTDGEPGV
jgi:hypothetical protein